MKLQQNGIQTSGAMNRAFAQSFAVGSGTEKQKKNRKLNSGVPAKILIGRGNSNQMYHHGGNQ